MPEQRAVKDRMLGALRRWWPVPAIVLVALVSQTLFHELVFGSPSGHAAGHLQSAGAIFPIVAMLAVILWSIPSSKRTLGVWLASALLVLSLLPAAIGNYQVV